MQPLQSLTERGNKCSKKLLLNSATFIFIQQHVFIYPNYQTFIYFKKRSFLNPFVFFHCIFSFLKGRIKGLNIRQEFCLSADNCTGKS